MSFYVRRMRPDGTRNGWVGPIRSERQAGKEAASWRSEGYMAEVHPSSAPIRELVRNWQRAADIRLGRKAGSRSGQGRSKGAVHVKAYTRRRPR